MTEEAEGICRESGKTGEKSTCKVQGPPFYDITEPHRADIYIGIKERYGWDPSGLARISKIVYSPPDAPRSAVAGYVSVENTDLSGYFPPTEFRMGVELGLVKESLDARIKAAYEGQTGSIK